MALVTPAPTVWPAAPSPVGLCSGTLPSTERLHGIATVCGSVESGSRIAVDGLLMARSGQCDQAGLGAADVPATTLSRDGVALLHSGASLLVSGTAYACGARMISTSSQK